MSLFDNITENNIERAARVGAKLSRDYEGAWNRLLNISEDDFLAQGVDATDAMQWNAFLAGWALAALDLEGESFTIDDIVHSVMVVGGR